MIQNEAKTTLALQDAELLQNLKAAKPLVWFNPNRKSIATMPQLPLQLQDMEAVLKLWERFAPFIQKVFPETQNNNGYITSPLKVLNQLKDLLSEEGEPILGRLFLKCDSDLAVAGSIKARGGFFEILHFAEQLAIEAKLIQENENYEQFTKTEFRQLFSQYHIGVGSTGNLGLSIGIISATLGFQVTVFMSSDAKPWKIKLLREKGVTVETFDGDFSIAIDAGRKKTLAMSKGYFVDDEDSKLLYLGYSVAALELKKDLDRQGIVIDEHNPLFVYSPCGVGGSSGGIAFGLRQVFGDYAHCFFVEPTHSPAVLLGLASGEMSSICVQDIGLDNKTEADGLAVGRPSHFATQISKYLISGVYTIEDSLLYKLLCQLWDTEKIFVEPSATAGLIGPQTILASNYPKENGIEMGQAVHVAWATGGALVPEEDREIFYNKGKILLRE